MKKIMTILTILILIFLVGCVAEDKQKDFVDENLVEIFEKMNNPSYGNSKQRKTMWGEEYEGKYAEGCIYVNAVDKSGLFAPGDYVLLGDRQIRYPHKIVIDFSLFLDESENNNIRFLNKNDYVCVEGELMDWVYLTQTVYLEKVKIINPQTKESENSKYGDVSFPIILSYPEYNVNISFLDDGEIEFLVLVHEELPNGQTICDNGDIVYDSQNCAPNKLLILLQSLDDYSNQDFVDMMCVNSNELVFDAHECIEGENSGDIFDYVQLSCTYSDKEIPNLDQIYLDLCLGDYVDWFVQNELNLTE